MSLTPWRFLVFPTLVISVLAGGEAIASDLSVTANTSTGLIANSTETTSETLVADRPNDQPQTFEDSGLSAVESVANLSDPAPLAEDEVTTSMIGQVTSVSQLSDVQPTDWAFQALQSLVERYGVIVGYPDATYRGNRALTRYEFAAGLNTALDRVNELIAAGLADAVTREDLATLQRLQEEFAAELATLRGRVDTLESRTAELEANQFSTTTKLIGDALFIASDLFGGNDEDENSAVFQNRVRLTFDSSFNGRDRLRARLQSGNIQVFDQPGNEARFAGELNTSNNILLDDLSYFFPLGDRANAIIFANAAGLDSLVFGNVITPFDLAAVRGGISRFSQRPPIFRSANTSAGAAINLRFTNNLSLQVGYGGNETSNPGSGAGLFNGNYGIIGQLTARNLFNRLDLGLTYVNSYNGLSTNSAGDVIAGIRTGTGSRLAAVDVDRPTVANSYGVQANFKVSQGLQIGGWVGFSAIRAIGVGDADVWNYGATLAFPDLGGRGNLGGIVVGVEPRLTGTTPSLGAALGRRQDPDTGLHVEAFYRIALNDNIDITPGFFWLTAPNHDQDNEDIVVGVLRTTFRF
jgi:hypothetical protein